MSEASIRALRNHGGDIIERAAGGEEITITKRGKPVAELRGLTRAPLAAEVLLQRWSAVPPIDADALRADIDTILDPGI